MKASILVCICTGLKDDQLRVQTTVGADGRIEHAPGPSVLAEQMRNADAWDFHVIGHRDLAAVSRRRSDPAEDAAADAPQRPADITVVSDGPREDPALGKALERYLDTEADRAAEGAPPRRLAHVLDSRPMQEEERAPRLGGRVQYLTADAKALALAAAAAGDAGMVHHTPVTIDDLITRHREREQANSSDDAETDAGTTTDATTASTSAGTTTLPTPAPTDALSTTTPPPAPTVSDGTSWVTAEHELAVVRIEASQPKCLEVDGYPRCLGGSRVVGTGFNILKTCDDGTSLTVIVTNAHVVGDAETITISVPSVNGVEEYAAQVLLIDVDLDIALVGLTDAAEADLNAVLVTKAGVADSSVPAGITQLPTLTLALDPTRDADGPDKKRFTELNEAVAALGYPEGKMTVAVSSGTITSSEVVFGHITLEDQAPISPGNSGGPLMRQSDAKVVGINFASINAEGAENRNFAIPSWRVDLVLQSFCKGRTQTTPTYTVPTCEGANFADCEFDFAPVRPHWIDGTDALFADHGCVPTDPSPAGGVFMLDVDPDSVFGTASPAIPHASFITEVNGVAVDKYGMGFPPYWFGDTTTPMEDILYMVDTRGSTSAAPVSIETPMSIKTCSSGTTTTHTVDLEYDAATYAADIAAPNQPNLAIYWQTPAAVEFERMGDIVIRPASLPMAVECLELLGGLSGWAADIVAAMEMDRLHDISPMLIVTKAPPPANHQSSSPHVEVCDRVTEVNGVAVSTMDELIQNFKPPDTANNPGGKDWELKTQSSFYDVDYVNTLQLMLDQLLPANGGEPLTPLAAQRARDEGLDVDGAIAAAQAAGPSLLEGAPAATASGGLDIVKETPVRIPAAVSFLSVLEAAATYATLGRDPVVQSQIRHLTFEQAKRGHSHVWRSRRKSQQRKFAV